MLYVNGCFLIRWGLFVGSECELSEKESEMKNAQVGGSVD